MDMFAAILALISNYWVFITLALHIIFSFFTSIHILLYNENERTSLAWISLVILSPVLGGIFYWLFGINRIKRAARKKHPQALKDDLREDEKPIEFHQLPNHWHSAIRSGHTLLPVNHLAGNTVELLVNGDAAYPQMIQSIHSAKDYVVLSSYIFDCDSLGQQFISALKQAHDRGVKVKVLLDGIGIRYSWHKSDRALKKLGVETARFLPAISLTSIRFINLRNHRKTLCVDGDVAFIGGMNISENNLVGSAKHPIDDVHFKVVGPVIDQISQVFTEDWFFATGELIEFEQHQALAFEANATGNDGNVIARVVQDGPDEYHNQIRWTLINALVSAKKSVKIITPYFIPDQTLMASLHAAALRGISIEIIVPGRSNIWFIDWVMQANFLSIMQHGIKIYKNQRPFDHSKMMIIDDIFSFIGSANWDARSLEFNFEINLECFDKALNATLTQLFETKKENAQLVLASEMRALPKYKKIRNNLVRLFSPYL